MLVQDLTVETLKALIIDDQMLSRKQLEQVLKSLGFKSIDQASTVAEAHEKLASKSAADLYDVIFIDWYMPPGKSGYQLLQQLREDRVYDGVACIMVSAESGQQFISEALKTGATAYVIKPVMERALKAEVDKILVWLGKRSGMRK